MTDNETTVMALRLSVRAFNRARDWQRFHQPRNLAMSIAIEAAELMEHYQWEDNRIVDQAAIADELADILMYCIGFADATGIDIAAAIETKLEKNKLRFLAD